MSQLQKVFCKQCGNSIHRERGRIHENIKLRMNFYCSRKCQYQHQTKRKVIVCENSRCDRIMSRPPAALSVHNYCSRSCAAHVNNQNFPKRGPGFKICANKECAKRITGERKYCSTLCISLGRRRYTAKEIIEIIKATKEKIQRTPTRREMKDIAEVAIGLFGSWNGALVRAGLSPNRSHSQRMYKRIRTKALDGHLCDFVSEAIIDNWLTQKGISHQRDVPYPSTNHKADWSIKDTTFIEYFGLAQDSPRYDRAIKDKMNICHKENIELIALYPQDIYPKICLNRKLGKYLLDKS